MKNFFTFHCRLENEFKTMFEGHKHERSHWVWCGFACLACNFKDVSNPASCKRFFNSFINIIVVFNTR